LDVDVNHVTEAEAYAIIKDRLGAKPSPLILELGMLDGYHTAMLISFAPEARYHGFEPDPRNVARIQWNRIDELINFYPAAVGDKTGRVPFNLATLDALGNTGSSSISEFTPTLTQCWPWLKKLDTIEVDSWRLDDFCKEHAIGDVDFLWMDVQGAERLVFSGATETLKRTKLVWTEYDGGGLYKDSSNVQQILSWFPGWKVLADCGGDILLEAPTA
jgi:2-O-methyltransferase